MTDAELAAHLSEIAGRILLEVRGSGIFAEKALGKAGDQTANPVPRPRAPRSPAR